MDKSEVQEMYGDRLEAIGNKYNMSVDNEKVIIESTVIIPISTIWAVNDYETFYRIITDDYSFYISMTEFKIVVNKYQQ